MTEVFTAFGSGAAAVMLWKIARALGAMLAGVAVLSVVAAVRRFISWAGALGVIGAGVIVLVILPLVGLAVWHRWTHTRGQVHRGASRHRRRQGVATVPQLVWRGSRLTLLRQARVLRPSLAEVSRWQVLRTDPVELGVRLVRSGVVVVRAAIEDVVVVFGRPRVGKTTWLIARILDAVGAVVTASTKADLWIATHTQRAERGPVRVFNPAGEGDADGVPIPSTLRFDPVVGCDDPVVAMDRATDMIPAPDGGDREHWAALAREAFGALLYAAAIGGCDMATVGSWVAHAGNSDLTEELNELVEDRDPIMADRLRSFLTINERTRTSITSSMSPALAWLAHPAAREVATGGHTLDVAELIASGGTVYLIGGVSGATAGLLAAVTGHIAREARRLAGRMPGGRLDPPLRIALDEADRICPVPLPNWVADMGGRGINILACFQARAQIIARWGVNGAKTIIDCAGAILLYAMATDSDEADYWSRTIGTREEETLTRDAQGMVTSRSSRLVPIVAPAQLRMLRRFQAVVLRAGCGPVIGYPARPARRRPARITAGTQTTTPAINEAATEAAPVDLTPGAAPTPASDPGASPAPAPAAGSPTPAGRAPATRVWPHPMPSGWAPTQERR